MTLELKKVVCGLTCLALLFCCQGIHCFNKQWQACQLALPRWIFRMHNIAPHLGVYIIIYKTAIFIDCTNPSSLMQCKSGVILYCYALLWWWLCNHGGDCAIMHKCEICWCIRTFPTFSSCHSPHTTHTICYPFLPMETLPPFKEGSHFGSLAMQDYYNPGGIMINYLW
jgi:hypothetical protein